MSYFPNLRRWALLFGILISFVFALVTLTQVVRIYQWGAYAHPILGYLLAGLLTLSIAGILIIPWSLIMRLPKALPQPTTEAEYAAYRLQMQKRLLRHRGLKDAGFTTAELQTDAGYERAMSHLHQQAHTILEKTARHTFLVTSISQNGKLDGLAVLVTQIRMIYQIASIYHQRPPMAELTKLYVNIAGTTLLAAEVDDLDITHQVEPLVNAMMKNSATKSIPWAGGIAQTVMDSLLEGTINAFFTLRVGVLAQQYCAPSQPIHRKVLRKNAYKVAAGMLGKLVMKTSGEVVNAILKTLKQGGIDTVKGSVQTVTEAAKNVRDAVVTWSKRVTGKAQKELSQHEEEREVED